jgi:hypothetical protein
MMFSALAPRLGVSAVNILIQFEPRLDEIGPAGLPGKKGSAPKKG